VKQHFNFSIKLTILGAVLYFGSDLFELSLSDPNFKAPSFADHLFLWFISVLTINICIILSRRLPKSVGFGYVGLGMLKIIAIPLFLLEEFMNQTDATVPFLLHFMVLYFIYMIIEIILLKKLLDNQSFS
jgi:hypothetical protein